VRAARLIESGRGAIAHEAKRRVPWKGDYRRVRLIIRDKPRRDLKREQLPDTKDHQEGDEAYCQHLPYFGDFWLNGASYHLLTLCLKDRNNPPVQSAARRAG